MCKRTRIRSQKRSKREHPDDRGRLLMDAIYESSDPEVQSYYRQVIREEDHCLVCKIVNGEKGWNVDDMLDRVHMRMGVRFFHLLSSVMQRRFRAEYPQAFIDFDDANSLATAV